MMTSSARVQPWESFELEVCEHVKTHVASEMSLVNSKTAKVLHKKAYPSKDRGADIMFDVVVEAYEPCAVEPSFRWVWECKDYPDRKVSVDEVEEFSAKLDQIGPMNVKGTIVTRCGFQEGAFQYAVSRKISLYVVQKELVRVTQFDHRLRTVDRLVLRCLESSFPGGRRHGSEEGWTLDMAIQVEMRDAGLLPPVHQ